MEKLKLHPERKREWVAALRSGEYKQGTGLLREGDNFCCLGVACDLAVKAGIAEWEVIDHNPVTGEPITYGIRESGEPETSVLPHVVASWLGPDLASFDALDPDVEIPSDEGPLQQSLAQCNDEHRMSFEEIADLIEDQL